MTKEVSIDTVYDTIMQGVGADPAKKQFFDAAVAEAIKNRDLPEKQKNLRITMRWILNIMLYGGYEVPQNFLFVAEDFTVGNGMLTQTMKLKRKVVLDKLNDRIEALYKEDK